MKTILHLVLMVLLFNTALVASIPHKDKLLITSSKKSKPKKYISEWRKAQWKKARLSKKKFKSAKKTKLKKQISKWKKARFSKIKKKRWSQKKGKRLTKSQFNRLNKIYNRVARKTNINKKALKRAFAFYKKNKSKKALSSNYLAIADYTKTARSKRLFIINLKNGSVYKHQVAHGKYSGSIGGRVKRSSNRRNTKMTPYGFFKVGRSIGRTKKKGYKYLSVKGLNKSNRKVGYPSRLGGRDIVIHPAKYVKFGGRSHGCFAICPQERSRIFSKLKNALLYSYTGR